MIAPHLSEAFAFQSNACASLGSPFMGRLMQLCATRDWPEGPIRDRINGWTGAVGPRDQSVPLRMAGALHALRLQGNTTLATAYPPLAVDDDMLWSAVSTVLVDEAAHINRWLDNAPQTNEVRRAATLIAVGHWLADRFGLPMRTSELGASGGLNLHWDQYGLMAQGTAFGSATPALTLRPDWTGLLPPTSRPIVTARAGVDLNPLDPANPADAMRLQAYLWPDQPDRMDLTRAAITAAATSVEKSDAIDWLATRLNHQDGVLHLIYTTIAWQYFPVEKQTLGEKLITDAGAKATENTPVAWFGMENDGGERGAALTLRLWPGDTTLHLGRADFHGRWVDWAG